MEDPEPKILDLTFGATCTPALAQYVQNINADRYADNYPEAVDAIKTRMYVDEFIESRDTAEAVIELAQKVKQIHHGGGFCIHKWKSNHPEVTRGHEGEEGGVNATSILGLTHLMTALFSGGAWQSSAR